MNHPDELTFAAIQPGETFRVERTFTAEDLDRFAALTGDHSPLHMDQDYAIAAGFGGRVIHGMLLATLFSNLVGMRIPGRHALYLAQDLAFRRPVLAGERVTAFARVVDKNPATRTILLATEIRNDQEQVAVGGMARVKIRDLEPVEEPANTSSVAMPAERKKTVLVAGGSGGVGSAVARLLGAAGMSVALHCFRNQEQADRQVRGILAAGGDAFAVQADLREPDAVARMIQTVADRQGRLDGLVNATMGELHHRPLSELAWPDFARHLDLQLKGVFHLCRAAHPLLQRHGGAVVNLLSQVVWEAPPPHMADYVAAKYALKGFSKALAVEWAVDAIRVNTVSPGLLRTEATAHLNERIFKGEIARTPLRRLATPEDVAHAVLFLLGEQATFLTGLDFPVSGGQVMT